MCGIESYAFNIYVHFCNLVDNDIKRRLLFALFNEVVSGILHLGPIFVTCSHISPTILNMRTKLNMSQFE